MSADVLLLLEVNSLRALDELLQGTPYENIQAATVEAAESIQKYIESTVS